MTHHTNKRSKRSAYDFILSEVLAYVVARLALSAAPVLFPMVFLLIISGGAGEVSKYDVFAIARQLPRLI